MDDQVTRRLRVTMRMIFVDDYDAFLAMTAGEVMRRQAEVRS